MHHSELISMISSNLQKRLNKQINLEFFSANLYLQMSSWCEYKGLDGCSDFFQQHSDEEMSHMRRLFQYVNETGAMAIIGSIDAPDSNYESIKDVFQKTYEHECLITSEINDLAKASFEEGDFSTYNFLQWYVAEQHEEEHLFKSILDKISLIGTDGNGLYFIDQEVSKLIDSKKESIINQK